MFPGEKKLKTSVLGLMSRDMTFQLFSTTWYDQNITNKQRVICHYRWHVICFLLKIIILWVVHPFEEKEKEEGSKHAGLGFLLMGRACWADHAQTFNLYLSIYILIFLIKSVFGIAVAVVVVVWKKLFYKKYF
jgi:hypothetical protein